MKEVQGSIFYCHWLKLSAFQMVKGLKSASEQDLLSELNMNVALLWPNHWCIISLNCTENYTVHCRTVHPTATALHSDIKLQCTALHSALHSSALHWLALMTYSFLWHTGKYCHNLAVAFCIILAWKENNFQLSWYDSLLEIKEEYSPAAPSAAVAHWDYTQKLL